MNSMDGQNGNIDSGIRRRLIFTAGLVALLTIYYLIMSLKSPAAKISELNSIYGYSQDENIKYDPGIFSDSAFKMVNRERSFLKARIAMASTDSLSLSVNLRDSIAVLEINGVTVHTAHIPRFIISKVFRKTDEYAITSMLSSPLNISSDVSSIEKEPVMLKTAPRDTSEYKPDIIPDTTISKSVNYMLEMDGGIRLYVYGSGVKRDGSLAFFFFDLADRFRNSLDIFRSVISLKVPDYHPYIKIWMEKSDARIIYRGLPRKGQVAVHI